MATSRGIPGQSIAREAIFMGPLGAMGVPVYAVGVPADPTITHPNLCSTAGPDCIFTVTADVALKVSQLNIRFVPSYPSGGTKVLTFQLPGQDIHASPFRFSLNLSRDVPSLVPLVGTSGTVEVSGLAFAVDGSVTPIPASSMIFSNPSPIPPPTGPNLTVAHPDVCSTAGPDCIFTLSADAALNVTGLTIRFFMGGGTHEFKFSVSQDVHASPFKFSLNLLASGLAPGFGQTVPVQLVALTENVDGTVTFSPTYDLAFTNPVSFLTTTPPTCQSDQPCSFAIRSNIHLAVGVKGYSLTAKNKATGVEVIVASADFSAAPSDLFTGITPTITIGNIDVGGTIVPPCGGSAVLSTLWYLFFTDGSNVQVPGDDFTLKNTDLCTPVQFHGVVTNLDYLGGCVGVHGTINVAGKMDTVESSQLIQSALSFGLDVTGLNGLLKLVGLNGVVEKLSAQGLLKTFNRQPVHVGLLDPATNSYYEYVVTQTDDTGGFAVGPVIPHNRADVVRLVPPAGSRPMKIVVMYDGDNTHSPVTFTKDITLQGENNTEICIQGTLIAQQKFSQPPPEVKEIHRMVQVFTTSIIPSQVEAQAMSVIGSVHNAITKAGGTTIDVLVYQGPGVPLIGIEGLGAITVPTLIVVSQAYGSPVAVAVIALAIIGALIILGIIVYFIVQAFTDLIVKGGIAGGTTAVLLALGFIGVVGVGGYLLMRRGGFGKVAAKGVKRALS